MFELDDDRRKLLQIRRMIENMERALEEAREYEEDLQQQCFDEFELKLIGGCK